MLIQPWNYHDESVEKHDLAYEWRNGPYSLLLLATQLRKHNHDVVLVDLARDLVVLKGDVDACLAKFSLTIRKIKPDIIGVGFFSVHYLEVQRALEVARQTCDKIGLRPLFIAGGIHASTEPKKTIKELGFDYAFIVEADLGIIRLADGQDPETVEGFVGPDTIDLGNGEVIKPLDLLPYPDWSLCDYRFYAYPSFAKLKFRQSRSLDMIMGRGCPYRCAFCAYNAFSKVRYYSAGYLVEQMEYMIREFGIDGIFFTDSSIGNNQRLLTEFCEQMIGRGLSKHIEWYGCMRSNQINESLLKLMWRAGCRFLFYGFESGSQRVLDLMVKGVTVENNVKAAELHKKFNFPYHASVVLGYPGEREEDIVKTLKFLRTILPPVVGINCYVPLPGSPDYEKLRLQGVTDFDNPKEWRKIGEVNPSRIYADVPEEKFRELLAEAEHLAYVKIPGIENSSGQGISSSRVPSTKGRLRLSLGKTARKFLRSGVSVFHAEDK